MAYRDRIISNPNIMLGKPVIKGTRLTVEIILKKMAEGATSEDILQMYPNLQEEHLKAVFEYALELIGGEELIDVGK
ncbi:MAG TPA: antitoxin [Cytophagales bacterium]|jgi:uncharacterized protein (DUF433 family)|nr:antitoxin [Cytophagales bacterium]